MRLLILLLTLLAAAALPAQEDVDPPLDPRHAEPPTLFAPIDLTRNWLVHPGDDPAFASPTLDDSQWQAIDTSKPLTAYGIQHPDFLWYRTHVHIPPRQHHLGLLLRGFLGSEQLFVNGVLTGPSRRFPQGGLTRINFDLRAPLPDDLIASGELTLAVRAQVANVARFTQVTVGFSSSSLLLLGEQDNLLDSTRLFVFRDLTSNATAVALTALILLIALALAIALRNDREYIALCLFLAGMLYNSVDGIYFATHDIHVGRWSGTLDALVQAVLLVAAIEFARRVLKLRFNRAIRIYEAVLVAGVCVSQLFHILFFGAVVGRQAVLVVFVVNILLLGPLIVVLPFYTLLRWRRTRDIDALLLAVPLLILGLYFTGGLLFQTLQLLGFIRDFVFPNVPNTLFFISWQEVTTFLFLLALLLFLILRTVRLARAQAAAAAEIAAAGSVQQLLLARSQQPTPGFTVESVYLPASQVGGDFFLVSPAPDGSLIVVVGDVSGKGLTAAMRVSMILGILRRETSRNPAEILQALNETLMTQGDTGFTTAACLHMTASGAFTAASAGHISPYLNGEELIPPPALPLGLASGQTYETLTGHLPRGQRLVLLSDGIPEARNLKGQLLGFDRLPALTRQPAAEIAHQAQQHGQDDDITVLTVALA